MHFVDFDTQIDGTLERVVTAWGGGVKTPPHLWRGKVCAKAPHCKMGMLENVLEKSRVPAGSCTA